ncbi:MAG: hypothetical protein ACE14S_11455 [Candidatus Bathyarchaeia archaeon]
MSAEEPIPWETALELCGEIRKKKAGRLFTQCWGCVRFSKGEAAKMCFASRPHNRGCRLVNKRYVEAMRPLAT